MFVKEGLSSIMLWQVWDKVTYPWNLCWRFSSHIKIQNRLKRNRVILDYNTDMRNIRVIDLVDVSAHVDLNKALTFPRIHFEAHSHYLCLYLPEYPMKRVMLMPVPVPLFLRQKIVSIILLVSCFRYRWLDWFEMNAFIGCSSKMTLIGHQSIIVNNKGN